MSGRRAAVWIVTFAVLTAIGCGGIDELRDALGPDDAARGRVVAVVDGDTIAVRVDGARVTVRYIGVDTPETKKPGTPVQCFGPAATERNRRLVADEEVELRFDRERRDRYGRLLAYVHRVRDGLFVNAALVRGGYGRALRIAPNTAHAAEFAALERGAQDAPTGLWQRCGP